MSQLSLISVLFSSILLLLTPGGEAFPGETVSSRVQIELSAIEHGKISQHYCSALNDAAFDEITLFAFQYNGRCEGSILKSEDRIVHHIQLLNGPRKAARLNALQKFLAEAQGSFELKYEMSPKYLQSHTFPGPQPFSDRQMTIPSSAVHIRSDVTGKEVSLDDFIDSLMVKQGVYYSGLIGGGIFAIDKIMGIKHSDIEQKNSQISSISEKKSAERETAQKQEFEQKNPTSQADAAD